MRFLLDTCAFIWIVDDPEALSPTARAACADPANELFLSALSAWEIVLKHRVGGILVADDPSVAVPEERQRHRIRTLPLDESAVFRLATLPGHHRDPFDRMLVCQALAHGLTLVTPDPLIRKYPVPTLW